jgi:NAD(P)-dependent dehydrogenase (short-subunit alcohol dehydrogenase family)
MTDTRIAFITGASRGIGKATALALARKGFDVVVTARTMEEGEAFEHGSRESEVKALPGSLRETAQSVEALGRRALPIRLDLLDLDSIDAAVEATLAAWGRIDLLVNNGIYQGPGVMSPVAELAQVQMQRLFQGNVFSQVHLIQRCLPGMLAQGSGTIVNVVSESGMMDPPGPIGKGGWGFAYSASKAAFIRMAGVMKVEYAGSPLRFFNMEPGFVITETMRLRPDMEAFASLYGGAPPEVPAETIAWLATAPGASELNGQTVFAQRHALAHALVPDWRAPRKRRD